jgi:hypothetical protein
MQAVVVVALTVLVVIQLAVLAVVVPVKTLSEKPLTTEQQALVAVAVVVLPDQVLQLPTAAEAAVAWS